MAAGDPQRRAHRADGEGVARRRAVGDLDAVAVAEEEDGVVADDVAAAQGLDADLVGAAGADVAVARVAGGRRQVAAGRLGERLSQVQRGPRGGVLLVPVVGLDDLHVVVGAEGAGGVRHQPQHDVDADRVVRRVHHRDVQGRDVERGARVRAEPGRSDHQPDALGRRRRGDRFGHARRREVDPDVGRALRGQRAHDLHARPLVAGQHARVLAHRDVPGTLGGRRQHRARRRRQHGPDQRAAHSPVGSEHRDANVARHRYSVSSPSSSSCARSLARNDSASG